MPQRFGRDAMHLSQDQKLALRGLFDSADAVEILHTVASILRHDIPDFRLADDVASKVTEAAMLLKSG
jgi:hypothetical protein